MAKHMTLDTRKGIAHGLECRLTFAQLATMHGRAVSTIANEVKNRMRWSNRSYGCSNAVCEHFETCSKIYRNADGKPPRRRDSRPKRGPLRDAFRPVSRIPSAKNS